MANVKRHAAKQEVDLHEEHHHHLHTQHDEHMVDPGAVEAGADDQEALEDGEQDGEQDAGQHYEQHYDTGYAQQYEGAEEGADGDVAMYEDQAGGEGEYEQDPNGVAYNTAVDAAAAVASAVVAVAGDGAGQEYDDQQQEEGGQEYAEQQHEGYLDDPAAHQYAEQEDMDDQHEELAHQGEMVDEQTLASHPATSRELEVAESMVVDPEHGSHAISSEVSQALHRFDYSSNPDGLHTLAATSSAVTPHGAGGTPSRHHGREHPLGSPGMYHGQKPMMPKFNRARNWSTEETKVLLSDLERIVTNNSEERRENLLRAHATFEEIAEVLRDKGYTNRDGQGCMIRWRNLLRVYKQHRASMADGNPPPNHPNMQYAAAIEAIYRFPPDGVSFQMHTDTSPGVESTPLSGSRSWSQANGSYETPSRKRAREMSMMSEGIDNVDQKLEQALEYLSQQSDLMRSLEERLTRAEEALKHSEVTVADLNATIGEKDAKREELQNQLMVTVQALSQVIAAKKGEDE
ncbi:hypothetical protein LPJ61_000023 [Coemansia biformis]|uniref:Myb-like domain-containing protein n=1 Tax=Coemansia biformis TaxID=1286918 RepID=A0A9W7YJH9_9FUNG|nr:hypothetical protein LPJ61_000023 [Coemansia biformis]